MNPPKLLLASCSDAASYPLNLVHKSIDNARAKQHQQRLNNPQYRLCIDNPKKDENQVAFRDWHQGQTACDKLNVDDDEDLALRLGDTSASGGSQITKPDPRCTQIFLSANSGRDSLKLTTNMLRRILTYYQVPAQYLDYLYLFGQRETSSDLKFGSFWSSTSLGRPRSDLVCPALGRSDEHYEMCFNLKGAEPKGDSATPIDLEQWSIRHTAVYHKLDVQHGTSVWIITKATWNMKHRFRDATGEKSEPTARTFDDTPSCYKSSFAAHKLIGEWSRESWRPYLQCLEDSIEAKTKSALDYKTQVGKENSFPMYNRSHVQEIIFYEETATQARLVLETNASVLRSLREFYLGMANSAGFHIQGVHEATMSFAADLHSLENDMADLARRAQHLENLAANRRQLILNLMQAQNSDSMTEMTIRSIEEAIVMRIITVVTLIYLPATFVSTFFSTDVVKYQPGGEGELYHTQYSSLAMDRWLQVTLPLTFVTLTIAFCLYKWVRRPLRQKLEQSKV